MKYTTHHRKAIFGGQLYVMYADSSQSPHARTVDFNDGGEVVSFVMSECEGSSTISEGSSDNLILVQEVFGECLSDHIVPTAICAWKPNEDGTLYFFPFLKSISRRH